MGKTLLQGLLLIGCFFGLFFALQQVDFVTLFKVKKISDTTEKKLGELLWETIESTETVVKNDSVNELVDKIIFRITDKNNIDRDAINVHIVEKDEINAFAMPGDHLVIYTGLIANCDNESELAGVICHEIAHIRKSHVMKKLVKEIGLTALISITTGGNSPQLVKKLAKELSSKAYDRELETEADLVGVDYMIKAELDPAKLADFLYKLASSDYLPEEFYWVSTHPESKERAKEILQYIKGDKLVKKPILSETEWNYLKKRSQ